MSTITGTEPPEYDFEGAYAALVEALPGWSVDLNAGIEAWNKRGDAQHVDAFVYTEVGAWVVNIEHRPFERSAREYDGRNWADIDAIVADVLAALRRAEAEAARRVAAPIPDGGAIWPSY